MFAIAATVASLLVAQSSRAQPVLDPGQRLTFASADGGSVDCRRGLVDGPDFLDCTGPRFLGTNVSVSSGTVRARVELHPPVLLGTPHYATARLYKDFSISGPPTSLASVQISATFDYRNFFVMGASYIVESGVTLLVLDLTTGQIVASQPLFATSRDGDQGIELGVSAASERRVVQEASGQLTALLRRGHDYRLVFELESLGQALLLGVIESDARATWSEVSVRVDEDEVELLAEHDAAVRAALAAHDAAVRGELAQHDADIKARLSEIAKRQEEIIRLLLTPQGRRESDLGSFPLNPNGAGAAVGVSPAAAAGSAVPSSGVSKRKSKKNS